MKGNIKECKDFAKEIKLIRWYSIILKDEEGQGIYTFSTKKKANNFYNELKKKLST